MMKIKILTSCSGFKFSFRQGETRDVDDNIAKDLINVGYAEAVQEAEPETPAEETPAEPETPAEGDKPKTSKRTRAKKSTDTKDVSGNVAES